MRLNLKIFNYKKFGIIFGSILICIYFLFLVLPIAISPLVNSYSGDIEKVANEMLGLDVKISKLGIYTTPLLRVGVKAHGISIQIPDKNDTILNIDRPAADLKLIPLLAKQVALGKISAHDLNINLSLNNKGKFEILEYFPVQPQEQEQMTSLPFGLKLSNNLPDVKINNYKIELLNSDTKKYYFINGSDLNISNFILDKSIKLSSKGKVVFDGRVVSNYDLKINNKIMPNILLDDIVFPKEVKIELDNNEKVASTSDLKFNVVDFFDSVCKNKLKADVLMDVTTSGTFKNPIQKGRFEINGLSVSVNGNMLPESYFKILFKGQKSCIDTILYTSADKTENTQIIGNIISGNKPAIDLTFRSNAKFNNVIRLIDSITQTFGFNDLKTLSATGGIDADFNINSDMKNIKSTGYIKILPASLKYGLYNISIDEIKSNISLMNNNVIIENTGFRIMGHPLKLSGSISEKADVDLAVSADKLSLKSLLLTAGQLALLKDNNVLNGFVSLNALLKGNLTFIKPDVTVNINDVNVHNKPSNAKLVLKNAFIKLLLNNNTNYSGDIDINSLALKLDGATISVPKSKIVMDSKDISIKDSYLLLNNSRIDVSGIVKDYVNENLYMNIKAGGNLAANDVMAFVPKEFHTMFPHKGIMPVKILATGDAKEQNIAFDLIANPSGYVQFLNIDKLRGKNTKIHSDIKVKGDCLKLANSSIYANESQIGTFNGEITNLANPNLNIHLIVPDNVSFTIPGMGQHSNITANGSVNIQGTLDNPKLKGKAYIGDVSVKDMDFALTNLIADFNGQGISGLATADKMKFGGIIGTNLSANYSLKDYTNFYLEDIVSDAFSGKVTGKLSYNIPKFAFYTDLTGKGLNSMDAVYAAVGIPKALTGTMNFNAKLNGRGVTDLEIIKSLKGNIDFNINDGRFVSIGRLENLVAAQNITSNSLLKSAISALSTASALQQTDKFKSIDGVMSLSGGSANLTNINVSGPMMSYHVTGLYNIIPNSASLTILGRLDSKVISYLGPLGQLSVQKLVSYIPGFGQATAKMIKLLTIPPSEELLKQIPPLSSGSTKYSDFKVIFNGPVEKASSVKSFMWLSVCDTTKIDLKQEGKDAVQAVKNNLNSQINSAKNTAKNVKKNVDTIIDTQKQNVNAQKQAVEQAKKDIETIKQNAPQSAQNLKNLLKNAAMNANKKAEPVKKTAKTETSSQEQTSTKSETKSESVKEETSSQNSSVPDDSNPAN